MIAKNCTQEKNRLLPSNQCLICDRSLEEVGGRRIIAQKLRGVTLSGRYMGGGNPDFPKRSIRLNEGEEGKFVMIWGQAPDWSDSILPKAREVYLDGKRPWYCQACGRRGCSVCGEPINLPMGSDLLSDDGRSSHLGIFPVDSGCINPECKRHR